MVLLRKLVLLLLIAFVVVFVSGADAHDHDEDAIAACLRKGANVPLDQCNSNYTQLERNCTVTSSKQDKLINMQSVRVGVGADMPPSVALSDKIDWTIALKSTGVRVTMKVLPLSIIKGVDEYLSDELFNFAITFHRLIEYNGTDLYDPNDANCLVHSYYDLTPDKFSLTTWGEEVANGDLREISVETTDGLFKATFRFAEFPTYNEAGDGTGQQLFSPEELVTDVYIDQYPWSNATLSTRLAVVFTLESEEPETQNFTRVGGLSGKAGDATRLVGNHAVAHPTSNNSIALAEWEGRFAEVVFKEWSCVEPRNTSLELVYMVNMTLPGENNMKLSVNTTSLAFSTVDNLQPSIIIWQAPKLGLAPGNVKGDRFADGWNDDKFPNGCGFVEYEGCQPGSAKTTRPFCHFVAIVLFYVIASIFLC